MQGCVNLHCGGPGQNVNTGCQPLLHDGPGKRGQSGGERGREEERQKRHERQEKIVSTVTFNRK